MTTRTTRQLSVRAIGGAIIGTALLTGLQTASAQEHFHPKGKMPSKFTQEIFEQARATLPFGDRQDFEEMERGFIGRPDSGIIMADAGNVAWDMDRYEFLRDGDAINSVHPSMLRQSQLNMNFGLYEVIPGIYQVRGFDLANITFMKGKTGWIVFDPLIAAESARAAKELVDKHLGEMPVVSVIYSHSHADHWGGVRGIVDEVDVRAGKVQIIAPRDFMKYAVSENVYAGNAMNRRLFPAAMPARTFISTLSTSSILTYRASSADLTAASNIAMVQRLSAPLVSGVSPPLTAARN